MLESEDAIEYLRDRRGRNSERNSAMSSALSLNKPLVGVHYLKGHISSNFIQYPDLELSFLSLIVSEGSCLRRSIK